MFERLRAHFGLEKPISNDKKICQAIEQNPETSQKASPQTDKCLHNFGYLNKRSEEKRIPEEYLACQKVTDCMLSSNAREQTKSPGSGATNPQSRELKTLASNGTDNNLQEHAVKLEVKVNG